MWQELIFGMDTCQVCNEDPDVPSLWHLAEELVVQEIDHDRIRLIVEDREHGKLVYIVGDEANGMYFNLANPNHNIDMLRDWGMVCGFVYDHRKKRLTLHLADFGAFKGFIFQPTEEDPHPLTPTLVETMGGGIECPKCGNGNAMLEEYVEVRQFKCRDCHHIVPRKGTLLIRKKLKAEGMGIYSEYVEVQRTILK